MHQRAAPEENGEQPSISRWECHCKQPPVLLGTYDASGTVNIKMRDRYWHVVGRIWTTCPRCGKQHTFDPRAGVVDTGDPTSVPDARAS
jgi:hypothetical protein